MDENSSSLVAALPLLLQTSDLVVAIGVFRALLPTFFFFVFFGLADLSSSESRSSNDCDGMYDESEEPEELSTSSPSSSLLWRNMDVGGALLGSAGGPRNDDFC